MPTFSDPVPLSDVTVSDGFWSGEQELIRSSMIPFQWDALNDRVPGAEKSWCIRNFETVVRHLNGDLPKTEKEYTPPIFTYNGVTVAPGDPDNPDPDHFYGTVWQDSDLYKWIETAAYSLAAHPDEQLESTVDGAVDLICAAQLDNGYINTYYTLSGLDKSFTNLRQFHELYCFGHLLEGAVAYWQATGKDKLLKAACRYADYVDSRFGHGEGQMAGYPGHEVAEMALVRLYHATGERRYLDLAKYFIDERGTEPHYFDLEARRRAEAAGEKYVENTNPNRYAYNQAHLPVRDQHEAVGHAVRAGYLYAGMADVARLTDDPTLIDACRTLWRNIVDKKLYITGGVGATNDDEAFSYNYDLPNDSAYSETCAAVALVFFARRMLEIEANSEYADVMELALYNTVLAGMALDGKSFFYVNPLEVNPEACRKNTHLFHVTPERWAWNGCACCPPNLSRLVESVQEYAYTENETTLFTHLYLGGSVSKRFGETTMKLNVEANLPWSGDVKASLDLDKPVKATLAFRIPGWTSRAKADVSISVHTAGGLNDGFVSEMGGRSLRVEHGYLYIEGVWSDGDVITLHLPMPVRMLASNKHVREDIGKVAFMRGPITYCMEQADNGSDLHLLSVDHTSIAEECKGVSVEDWNELGTPMKRLMVPALREEQSPSDSPLYSDWSASPSTKVTATFIPYYAWANRGEGEMSVWIRG